MIVNQVQRSLQPPLQGLGIVTPQINRLDLNGCVGCGVGQERREAAEVIGAIIGTTLYFGAVGFGAFQGAKRSPGWAAGGAIIGSIAFTGVGLMLRAITGR